MEHNQTLSSDKSVLCEAIRCVARPLFLTLQDGAVAVSDAAAWDESANTAYIPPVRLENLGDPTFCADYGLRYPYIAGSMANGISSCEIVEAMSRARMLGFFGAGGLSLTDVERAIERITTNLPVGSPFGFNLIHSPHEPHLEAALADLYIRRHIHLIEASAFLDLTLPLVRYRLHGIHRADGRDPLFQAGEIITPNRVMAKVSRVEVAAKFFAPPSERFLRELVNSGDLTPEQALLAAQVPVAQDLTAEADSGGHTDNRPAVTLFPTILALAERLQAQHHYPVPLRIGLGGGIATPLSTAAAFAMGAAYVVTGTINQACVESGTSPVVRQMLAEAGQADVTMAPAADMFEMGVNLQVLKRGTMFAMRAAKLYEIYRSRNSLDEIPAADLATLEKTIFKVPLDEIWRQTCEFFQRTDPAQIERAERDPKHKMALTFRWYLGLSARWAQTGVPDRRMDYQVWCGPAMGAFNEWTKGSFLEKPQGREIVPVAMNLLYGAAVATRLHYLRAQSIRLEPQTVPLIPLELGQIEEYLS